MPAASAWKTIVPERKEAIESVAVIGGRIVAQYLVDVQSRLSLFGLDGTSQGERSAAGRRHGRRNSRTRGRPGHLVQLQLAADALNGLRVQPRAVEDKRGRSRPRRQPSTPACTRRKALFATSKDGTRVPFFLTAQEEAWRATATIRRCSTGYGGFSVSTLPTYRQDVPAWLERGGIWVTVSMRGGAEYGEAWHTGRHAGEEAERLRRFHRRGGAPGEGRSTRRPTTLGIMGGSNGGLLVGAVMEQRPDLFAVALPGGRRDGHAALRQVHRRRRCGRRNTGRASNPAQFPFLIKYSPLHNIKPGTCYPATLITTADHDDRVVPSHSFKFAAALQAAQGCDEAGAHSRRGAGLARVPPDRQADCRARRPVGVRRRTDGDAIETSLEASGCSAPVF